LPLGAYALPPTAEAVGFRAVTAVTFSDRDGAFDDYELSLT
jgi:hypothetical protein